MSAGLRNGDMIYVSIDEHKTGVHEAAQASGKCITKDGNIIAREYSQVVEKNGFRPGMMPLRRYVCVCVCVCVCVLMLN